MATADEIERRVEHADTARSATRAALAQQVGALAQRRAAIAEELADIEGQLGEVLAAASEVMSIEELATFTDVPAADLTLWFTARKPACTKRKRPAASAGSAGSAGSDTNRGPSAAKAPMVRPTSAPPEAAPVRTEDADARVPVEVA